MPDSWLVSSVCHYDQVVQLGPRDITGNTLTIFGCCSNTGCYEEYITQQDAVSKDHFKKENRVLE